MKRLAVLTTLLATPALAQQAPPPSPAVQAYQSLAHQAMEREAATLAEVIAVRAKVDGLEKELLAAMKTPKP